MIDWRTDVENARDDGTPILVAWKRRWGIWHIEKWFYGRGTWHNDTRPTYETFPAYITHWAEINEPTE